MDSVWCNCPNLEHAETFFESFPALGHTNRVSVGHLILCAFKTCQTQSWLQRFTKYHCWVTNFAIFCPQILTFCEAERYPMATCHDHWPRLEVQRETLLGDDGMRRLRHASVPVCSRCRSLGSFGVCTPLASNLASNESEIVWISVNFKASGRSRDGQMAARRRGIRLHHAWNFFQSQARIARNVAMFFLACRNTPWKSLCTDSSETGHSLSWLSLQSRLTSRDYAFIRDCTHQEMGWMTHHFPMSLVGHTWVAWCCMSYSEFGHGSGCQRGRERERPMTAAYMMHAASGCRSCYAIHSKGETQQSDFPILDKTWRTPTFGQVPRSAWVKMNEVYVCDKISQLSHKVALAQLAKIVFSRASSIRKEWPQLFVNQTRQTQHEAPTGKDWRLPPKLKLVANSVQ